MLRAADITGFVQRHAHRLSPGRAKLLVTALRSFFRYLLHRGEISLGLAACVPIVPNWPKSTLPSSLYRLMAQRIGREYTHSQAKTVFRNLLDLSGKAEVTANSVVVTLDKRAHNPYLVASGLAD